MESPDASRKSSAGDSHVLFKRESHTSPRKTAAREGSISRGRARIHDVKRQVRRTKNRGAETRGAAGETRRRVLPRPVGPSRPDSPSRRRGAESQAGALVTGMAVAVPWPPPEEGLPQSAPSRGFVLSTSGFCRLDLLILGVRSASPGPGRRRQRPPRITCSQGRRPSVRLQEAAPKMVSPKTQGGRAR